MKITISKNSLRHLILSVVLSTTCCVLTGVALVENANADQYPISPTLMCQNPWAPRIPTGEPGEVDWGPLNNPDRATFTANTNMWNLVQSAGFKLLRIGGNDAMRYNKLDVTNANGGGVVELIRSIKAVGAEPLFQVPYQYSTEETKALWDYLNGTKPGQQNLGVKYWSIGNEMALNSQQGNIPEAYSATFVATFTKRISKALKEKDPNAFVQAGDEAWFHADTAKFIGGANDISGKDANGNWIIDAFSWHRYNITNLDEDRRNIAAIQGYIDAAATKNNRPANKRIQIAYGEFNSHFNNAEADPSQYSWTMKTGQLFAELYGIGMEQKAFAICPWSMAEADSNRNPASRDLGIFDVDATGLVYSGRSSYHHSAMLGANMQDNYASATDNYTSLKIVAMTDYDGTTVMLINTNQTSSYNYSLNLSANGSTVSGGAQINVDAGLNTTLNGTVGKYETQTLVFNANGALTKRYTYNYANHWTNRIPPSLETWPNGLTGTGILGKIYWATSTGIAGCTGSKSCTAEPSYIDLNADTGFRFTVAPGAGKYNLYLKVSVPSSGSRSMGVTLGGAAVAIATTDFNAAPRPGGKELGPWAITLAAGNNVIDILDNRGTAEFDIQNIRLVPR